MMTKYGDIPNNTVVVSLERLVGKVYKILPMREENCDTLDEYIENLLRELVSQRRLIDNLKHQSDLLSLISTLESVKDNSTNDENFQEFRSDVLKSLNIIKKMIVDLKREG